MLFDKPMVPVPFDGIIRPAATAATATAVELHDEFTATPPLVKKSPTLFMLSGVFDIQYEGFV